MNKLPIIEPKKKPNKYTKGINPIQNEDDKRKNNIYGNNYDIAINYYNRNINNDKNNTASNASFSKRINQKWQRSDFYKRKFRMFSFRLPGQSKIPQIKRN